MSNERALRAGRRKHGAAAALLVLGMAAPLAAQTVTIGIVGDESSCCPVLILPSGGEFAAIQTLGSARHDNWQFDLTAKGGDRIGMEAAGISDEIFQVLGFNFRRNAGFNSEVHALITFPDGRLYLDSGSLASGVNAMGTAIAQIVGDSPTRLPVGAGLVLPNAARAYFADLGSGPVLHPDETADTIRVAFAPVINPTSVDVGGCTYGGELLDALTGEPLIVGYNVYRMVDGGSVPTAAELGVPSQFEYFASLDPARDPALGLHDFLDPDGLPFSGDEVIVYRDAPTALGGGPRPSGSAPIRGAGVEYWYAFQPVVAGDPADWLNLGLSRLPPADRAVDQDGDGTDDSVDADLDGSLDFISPQADLGETGLGLSSQGRPLLSKVARSGIVDPMGDLDGDTVPDAMDNCPNTPNSAQADADGDLVGDPCDACEGFDDAEDDDADGLPNGCDPCPMAGDPNDADCDGVLDGCDACPYGDDGLDDDGDGFPDACDSCPGFNDRIDGDGDGIPDGCDACPGSDDALDADADGVPDGCDRCRGFDDTLDGDGDGVPDGCDICAGFDDAIDDDGDAVPNGCDLCEGFDDALDDDGDGTPDGCDLCRGADDALDDDGDGTPDGCDLCPGFDDALDDDRDGTPDGCDLCPGFDDALDADGDGTADGCDLCPGSDDALDVDVDGTPDGCDLCPGSNDALDDDADGVPDGCDACPGFDDTLDADADGIADGCDLCPGFDDALDADGDGTADGCDLCPGSDDALDDDGDGVPDGCDVCPGFDDTLDVDGDGIPDDCDNCPLDPNPAQEDSDRDGIGDACECFPDPPASGPGSSLRLTGDSLSWDPVADASNYPVFRGTIPMIGGGLVSRPVPLDHDCLLRAPSETTLDAEQPSADFAFYYLVSAANDCGDSADGLGRGSDGVPRTDPGCP